MRWQKKYNIKQYKVSGESRAVDEAVVRDWMPRVESIMSQYSEHMILNCDETGLFFRALPDKTLVQKGKEAKGGKVAKER